MTEFQGWIITGILSGIWTELMILLTHGPLL